MTHIRKTIIATAAIIGLSAPAFAGAPQSITLNSDDRMVTQVNYSDLNLSTSSGMQALENRIRSAAKRVCGKSNARASLREEVKIRKCFSEAKAAAMDTAMVVAEKQRISNGKLAAR